MPTGQGPSRPSPRAMPPARKLLLSRKEARKMLECLRAALIGFGAGAALKLLWELVLFPEECDTDEA